VVATSTDPSDDRLADVLAADGIAVFRGPLDDVLARFVGALDACPAEHVVRLTGDCPLVDPAIIDATVDRHLQRGADYTQNRLETKGFPKGQDVEAMTAAALRRAAHLAATPQEREHVTWGIWNHPERYRIERLEPAQDQGHVRWTVDRPDDYAFVAAVYAGLHPVDPDFTSEAVRSWVRGHPEWARFGGDPRI
jgi:spore coat polysaccharide biosynthesis protein SpsF